ncbi:MAG: deoxyribonuclease, partial [Solirubrobacteraceae bacterium]|nr:deoxyribonuclease [Solirubrobacteraceae bacterium]
MSAPHGNDPLRPSHLPGPAAAARERPDRFAGPLVGAHVSPAGGLWKAVERGIDRGAESIQIFNQSPRAWRPTAYGEDDFARFRAALAASPVATVMIHAVYLLNCATDDPEIAGKSQAALIGALRMGDAIGAHSVVLHPGSAKLGPVAGAIERAGRMFAAALAESDRCPLHLENTAGAGGTLGRSFDELAALLDAAGADPRLGLCLDSCHLLASGYEIRAPEDLAAVIDECERAVGPGRIGSL